MEPQKEKTVRHPKKSKKRKLSPNKLGRATGPMRPRWDLADRQLEFKKARLSTILFAENCEVTHDQLCELLKYAVLGKSCVPKPRYEIDCDEKFHTGV
uniref:Uncharacterized protein n=1 Tax=Castor canadensis TaxID=51338 RepID=A0A8C0ZRN7_CASCN